MVNVAEPAPADREAVVAALADLLLAALEAEDREAGDMGAEELTR